MESESLYSINQKTVDHTLIDSEVVKSIREQRHDFMNHIQVIWGYLQLQKPEQAVRYITQLNEESSVFSSLFRMGNPSISLFLYNYIKRAYKLGLRVDLEVETDYQSIPSGAIGHDEVNKLNGLFEEVLLKAASREEKILYIDLFDEEDVLYIVVSNNSLDDYTEFFDRDREDNLQEHIRQDILKLGSQGIVVLYAADGDKIAIKVSFN